ncbi:uncharacterized protein METZ01_LOCUS503317, partial [marine metagenome]
MICSQNLGGFGNLIQGELLAMTQTLQIDRDRTAVVIMDFQQRIVANNASDPDGVVTQAAS